MCDNNKQEILIMQEKSLIKKNILSYLTFKGITPYECCKKTGITRGILTQNNGIVEENIAKFLAYYTEVDVNWLITGQGKMIKEYENESRNLVQSDVVNENEEITYNKSGESEQLKSQLEKLKNENEDLNKKLIIIQDSMIKLMSEKIGVEFFQDNNGKQTNPKVKGFGALHDPQIQMILKQIIHEIVLK